MLAKAKFHLRTLFVFTFLIAGSLGWLRLPEVTARRFVANPQEFVARGLVTDDDRKVDVSEFAKSVRYPGEIAFEPAARSWWDRLAGRQTFQCGLYHFTVTRGEIEKGPRNVLLCI